jgi:hypothetical protein
MDAELYRCRDCTGAVLQCASCLIHEHRRFPLHRIEVREALYFLQKIY